MKNHALCILATQLIGIGSIFAAGWDGSFAAFPALGPSQRITAIHYLDSIPPGVGRLYAAVSYDNGVDPKTAYLYRLDGASWNVVLNSTVYGEAPYGSEILALAGASTSSGDRLFVGGTFTSVGPSGLTALNIAMLNPNPTSNPTWEALVTAGMNGTDDTVTSLAAYRWWDSVYDSILVFVGGKFTYAGDKYSPRIADWRGLNFVWNSTWQAIGSSSGGYGVDNDSPSPAVYGIAADIQQYTNQTSILNGLYLTGNFRKTVGSPAVVNNHVAKWNGSSWKNLGRGLLRGASFIPPDQCAITFNPYDSMRGYCATFANGTAYIGGFFDDVEDKNGMNYFDPFIDSSCCGAGYGYTGVCAFEKMTIAKISGTEILSTSAAFVGPTLNGAAPYTMTTVGGVPFVGGGFSDPTVGIFYAAKLASGVWQALPSATGSPDSSPISATADSTSAYFATASGVFRYIK